MNEIQSKSSYFSAYKEEVEQILAKYPENFRRSAVMPLLHLAQRTNGYVTREAMAEIAGLCDVAITEVASVTGFYSLYYEQPSGKFHIQVCNDLPCALRGADAYLKQVCEYLGVGVGETTTDGLFTVEAVKCLAACNRAPMFQVQVGDELHYHENQTIEKTIAWIEEVRGSASGDDGRSQKEAQS